MKAKSSIIAQKLLNLYRQEHVIFGGWSAVNEVFLNEATPDVLKELRDLPTGKFLIKHIENLRSGKTPRDSIERDLLPYGGMMAESDVNVQLTQQEWEELERGINNFTPDETGLNSLKQLSVIKKFGDQWLVAIRAALTAKPELIQKWDIISQTSQAYYLWNSANEIINQPLSERTRAQVQADMPEYETYLPMFGDAGVELLEKLRSFITTIKSEESENTEGVI